MNLLKIAFVANNKNPALFLADPAFIYRCENLALALSELGHQVSLLHISELRSNHRFDIVVLHRPKRNWLTQWRLHFLKRRGCKILADFDDLVFLPEYAAVSPGVINNLVSLQQTENNFASHLTGLRYCDACIVSVTPLLEKITAIFDKPVTMLPNTVHRSWYNLNEDINRLSTPRLTYFPGTRSHDKDFATIKPVLEQLLSEEPELKLQITGVLTTDLRCRSEQLILQPKQPFADYANQVAKSWVNLAPLEDTEFNHHKSALKAIEASWFNAPTLASPIPDMQRLQAAGAELMYSQQDWYSAIKALLNHAHYASKQPLREKILAIASAEQNAKQFLLFVSQL